MTATSSPELDDYQVKGVQFLSSKQGAILADVMGLGKTPQSIKAAEIVGHERILVVVKKSLIGQWVHQTKLWAETNDIGVWTTKTAFPNTKWIVTTYETLVYRGDFLASIPKIKNGLKFDVIIVDEAHAIKNQKAKRSKAVKMFAKQATYRWLLSGTPMKNHPDELWSLLNCIDPREFRSFWKWVHAYLETRNNGFGIEVGGVRESKSKEFGEMLNQYMLRRDRDLLDLPALSHEDIYVQMEPKQAKMYGTMRKDMLAVLDSEAGNVIIAPNALAKLTRLRQIADDTNLLPETPPQPASGKTEWLLDFLADYTDDHKVLVFSNFSGYVGYLSSQIDHPKCQTRMVVGSMSANDRTKACEDFQNDPNVKVMLGTYGAMGEGLNLTAATVVVLLDQPWTPDQIEQAESRAYRRGQENPVHVIRLLTEGSVDEHMKKVLEIKDSAISEALAMRLVIEAIRKEGA